MDGFICLWMAGCGSHSGMCRLQPPWLIFILPPHRKTQKSYLEEQSKLCLLYIHTYIRRIWARCVAKSHEEHDRLLYPHPNTSPPPLMGDSQYGDHVKKWAVPRAIYGGEPLSRVWGMYAPIKRSSTGSIEGANSSQLSVVAFVRVSLF
jgi:hypothetical protein